MHGVLMVITQMIAFVPTAIDFKHSPLLPESLIIFIVHQTSDIMTASIQFHVIVVIHLLIAINVVTGAVTDGIGTSVRVVDLRNSHISSMVGVDLAQFTNMDTLLLTNNILAEFPNLTSIRGKYLVVSL